MSAILITPKRYDDDRGWFTESWSRRRFSNLGIDCDFCQDNHSLSIPKHTLRGLHFQKPPFAQSKLVRCIRGSIYDVAVDIRPDSPTFAHWVGAELSAENGRQLFIPAGHAHGFVTLTRNCEVVYKVDEFYSAEHDAGVAWNDKLIGIEWPIETNPVLSEKDEKLPSLQDLNPEFPYNGEPLNLTDH